MKVGVISDACRGSESLPVVALAQAFRKALGAEVLVTEPDDARSPSQPERFPSLSIQRLSTREPAFEKGAGRVDYARKAAAVMHELRPDLLVVCSLSMPAMLYLKRRPRFTVFYSTELILNYGAAEVILVQALRRKIDFIIWPEDDQRAREAARCGLGSIPSALLRNAARAPEITHPSAPGTSRELISEARFDAVAREIAARMRNPASA